MQNLFLFFIWVFSNFESIDQSYQWVGFDMTTRTTKQGKMVRIDSHVSYKSSAEMVTHFLKPMEVYVMNNSLGEVRIYNSDRNEVVRVLDNRIGSQNSTFFYFLQGNTSDMGLEDSGFKLENSRIEDMFLISEYKASGQTQGPLDYVELVSNGEYPVFMGYVSKDGGYLKKMYYYDFDLVAGASFPMSITEIEFIDGDSIISKTSFADFRFDNPEDKALSEFRIPDNAILLK